MGLRWARAGVDYTYTTLSDTTNATSCNNGCGETKWKCKDGYTYDETSKSCKAKAKTYTITVDDYGEFNSGAGEYIFQRSVTYDSPDASIDIISGYNCNTSNCSGPSTLGGTFTKSVSTRMDTIQSNVGGNGGDYQLNLSFTGCSIKINGTTKSIRSVSPCESTTIQMPNGDKYIVVYSFNGSKKSCSDYNLETSSDCKYGYTLLPSKEYPTDDFGNKCGTCVKNVTFSANTIDCGGSAQSCEYFYPCTQDVYNGRQCYKCITSLYKKFIVIWIDSEGRIQYVKKDTFSSVPYSYEYVVLTTMNDSSSVTDGLGEMEGWSPTSKFDNTIGIRRGFYELYIKQTHSDSTSQCYLSTDENLEIWKRGNPGVSECEKKISGYTTSFNNNYAFGVGSGVSTHLSNADIKKMFPNKKINDTSTGIDIAGTTGSGETIMSKYVWYRITNVKPGDVIDIYPRCYRDVNLNKGFGGRCYFGWKGQNSSLGNYTNCKKLK